MVVRSTCWICIMLIIATVIASAQVTDSNEVDEELRTVSPKRQSNFELVLMYTNGSATGDVYGVANNGTVYKGGRVSKSEIGLSYGFGMHIPVINVSSTSTIWLVPAITHGYFFDDFREETISGNLRTGGALLNVEVQLHATIGYGGLRKKYSVWGIEGGLGATFRAGGYGSETENNNTSPGDIYRILPTLLIDFSYTPKNVYRIRIMSDILQSSMSYGISARQYSLALVIGL